MKRILASLIIILSLSGCVNNFTPIANAYSISYNEYTSYTYDDINVLSELIAEQISNMEAAHQMAEAGRQLGYSENHHVIELGKNEYQEAENTMSSYQAIYDDLVSRWAKKEEEYPIATYIWSYLKGLDYSNQVCAGILGNIMAEVGSNTLNIDTTLETKTYYGMCQWNKKIYPDVYGVSLYKQCEYLRFTIKNEFDMFGYSYYKGFSYDDFLTLDIKDSALAFAKCYERCSSSSYRVRQENAIIAYNYFTGE